LFDSKDKVAAVRIESAEEISPMIGEGLSVTSANALVEVAKKYLYLRYNEKTFSLTQFDLREFGEYQRNPDDQKLSRIICP